MEKREISPEERRGLTIALSSSHRSQFTFILFSYLLLDGKFHEEKSHVCFVTFKPAEPNLVSGVKLAFRFKYLLMQVILKTCNVGVNNSK